MPRAMTPVPPVAWSPSQPNSKMADDFNLYEGLDTTPDLNTLVAPATSSSMTASTSSLAAPSAGSMTMPVSSVPAAMAPGYFQISTSSSMSYRSEPPPPSTAENALYLTDLDWWTTDRQVRDLCAPYGRVSNINFVVEKNGKSKGIAVVVFEDDSGAKSAVNDWRNPERTPMFSGRPVGASVEMQNALPQPKRDSGSDSYSSGTGNRQNNRSGPGGGRQMNGTGNRNNNRPHGGPRSYSRGDDDRRSDNHSYDAGRHDREGESTHSQQRDHPDTAADAGDARTYSDSKQSAGTESPRYSADGRNGGSRDDRRNDDRSASRYEDRDTRRNPDGDRRDDRGGRRYEGGGNRDDRRDDRSRDYRGGGNRNDDRARSDDRPRYESDNRGGYDNRRGGNGDGGDRRGGGGDDRRGGGRDDRSGGSHRYDNRSENRQDGGNRGNYKKREREYDNEADHEMRAGSPHRPMAD